MNKPKPILTRLFRYTNDFVNNFKNRIKRIEESENLTDSEKVEKLTKLLYKQNKQMENMVNDQDAIFSQVQEIEEYRKLAMRGMSFMAGGHELCGIFDTIKNEVKSNKSLEHFNNDIERLETIFIGQMAMTNREGFDEYNGETLAKHFEMLFKKRVGKNIVFTDEFRMHNFPRMLKKGAILTIISNLINNAIYFTHTVFIDYVDGKVIVSDNGDGIATEDQNKLFKVGFSKRIRGHGIGLFLCQEMARDGYGDLYFDPDNKYTDLKGASFILELPST